MVPGKFKNFPEGGLDRLTAVPCSELRPLRLALRDLPPRRARADGLRVDLRGNLVCAFADTEQGLARLVNHGCRLPVEGLRKFADGSQLLEQLVGLSIGKTG